MTQSDSKLEDETVNLIIAAGGTGGHLFPGIAVAKLWKEKWGDVSFIGSEKGLEQEILKKHGLEHEVLSIGRLKGEGWMEKIKTFLHLPLALRDARGLLIRKKPSVILGVGGYSSGPVVLVAFLMRIPRAILEPNSIPGLTNKWLGHFAQIIFLAFPETSRFFPKGKIRVTGTPVRRELILSPSPSPSTSSPPAGGGETRPFTILVLGGSQGAHTLNVAMKNALPQLIRSGKKIKIFHQTGNKDFEEIQSVYQKQNLPHQVKAFFEDMESIYCESDLVVSRAGASTVAELIETRKPSLLVPYPFAADDHQRWNALSVVNAGGAEMILTEELESKLCERLLHYESHREELKKMSESLAALRKVSATEAVVAECRKLAVNA